MKSIIIKNEECWPELGLGYDEKLLLQYIWSKDLDLSSLDHSYIAEPTLRSMKSMFNRDGESVWILLSNDVFKTHYKQHLDTVFEVIQLEDDKVAVLRRNK